MHISGNSELSEVTKAGAIVQIEGLPVPKRYKPSRFNAHTFDQDWRSADL
jgi:hypothetical protein